MAEFSGTIGHIEDINSPWAAAGGVVKTVQDVEAIAQTGVGWIEDGSHTILERLGNAIDPDHPELGETRTVYYHDPVTGETTNSLGMPGKSIDVWEAEIPEKVAIAEAHGKKYFVNVAPVSQEPVAESYELIERSFEAGAHGIILNAGCPNVVTEDGGRHELLSRNHQALWKVLTALRPLTEQYAPIFVRPSPQIDGRATRLLANCIRNSGVVSAVFSPNTWPNYVPLDEYGQPILEVPGGAGGRSGPAMAKHAAEDTRLLAVHLGTGIDVISSSSIVNASELQTRIDLGARAGAGTTFFWESSDWQTDVDRLLHDLAA